jgi:hypothetical protein
MSITTTQLTRVAGLSAVAAGLLFIGVQINHPPLDLALVTTSEWVVRETMKLVLSVLALIGITGMYLAQVKKAGALGLVGYGIFGAGFLIMLTVQVVGVVVLPAIAQTAPSYVSDVLAVAGGGTAIGDIGFMKTLSLLGGITYMAGGLVFGIALFRANVLARWASILLAAATTLTMAIPLLPWINQRLFAVPTGVALIALGHSLWRQHRPQVTVTAESSRPAELAVVR